ncbi:hypothetical protein P3W45_001691 [Vairimorpha bombi]
MSLFSLHNQIYHNNQNALDFLLEFEIVVKTTLRSYGGGRTLSCNIRTDKEIILYRYNARTCRKRRSIFKGTIFKRSSVTFSTMVGGVARRVQVDETAIARGRLITDISNAHDESTNVKCFLEMVPNLQRSNITEVLNKNYFLRHGVQYDGWDDFIAELTFRRNYLRDHSENSLNTVL